MLHILWLILKFILIILGILLGLLLLAVLLVLFCPVRYKASAVKAEGGWKQTEGEGIVSWLFHGISLRAEWKDQERWRYPFICLEFPVETIKGWLRKKCGRRKLSGNKENTGKSGKRNLRKRRKGYLYQAQTEKGRRAGEKNKWLTQKIRERDSHGI